MSILSTIRNYYGWLVLRHSIVNSEDLPDRTKAMHCRCGGTIIVKVGRPFPAIIVSSTCSEGSRLQKRRVERPDTTTNLPRARVVKGD